MNDDQAKLIQLVCDACHGYEIHDVIRALAAIISSLAMIQKEGGKQA